MQIKSIKIGRHITPNNVFLAPMAGYTDYSIRHLQIEQGVGLAFTELVSAKGLAYNSQATKDLLFSGDDYNNTAVQLFGSEPYYMRKACESEELSKFNIVDINMGCPVPKVYKNGEGSALLGDIKKAQSIIKECVKSGKEITVKIRTGLKKGDNIATEFCKMAEDNGAKLVTIHGRIREDYYSGEIDFEAIYKAKKSVNIPVIANGGIFTKSDAKEVMDRTGADGVMLARGAIANPFLACEILNGENLYSLKDYILAHINLMRTTRSDERVAVEFRKFTAYYFKGMIGVKELKNQINSAKDTREIIELIKKYL